MKFQNAQQGGDTTADEFEVILDDGIEPGSAKPAKPAELGRVIRLLIPGLIEYEVDDESAQGSTCFSFYLGGQ